MLSFPRSCEKLSQIKSDIAPRPEDLWERGGATVESTVIEPGREENVPYFHDSRISKVIPLGEPVEIISSGERVGTKVHYRIVMTTGITRDAVVYLAPPDKQESMQFTIHMDTPWFTGEEGHNDRIAEAFMRHTGQPVILVGPENMEQHKNILHIVKNLGSVAMESSQISLALASQDSMQIAAELASMKAHTLPRQFIEVGESRGAMVAPGKHPHGAALDIRNVYYDITDPCMAENVFNDKRNLIKVPAFAATMALDLIPVGMDLLRRKSLHRERGTLPTRAEYIGAAVLGTGPAILSGEAGRSPLYLPSDTAVHLVNFRRNPLAHHEQWRDLYAHTQFAGVNLKGAHLGLAYSSVQRHVIERINRFITEYDRVGGVIERMNLLNVHLKDDQRYIGPDEHMPEVA